MIIERIDLENKHWEKVLLIAESEEESMILKNMKSDSYEIDDHGIIRGGRRILAARKVEK